MALILHRSDHPHALAEALAGLLAREPLDVFTPEVVVVGARGVERWLTQRLAHTLGTTRGDDGVAAGLELRSPASLTAMLLGRERDDPWHADRLVWSVLEALDHCADQPGFEVVAHHLGAGTEPEGEGPDGEEARWQHRARRSRRYAVARRLAGLFASYARDRPYLLQAWEEQRDEDGTGAALAADLAWQPMLWRAVVDTVVDRGLATESPVARHRRVVRELASGGGTLPGLPGRLSLFGHTRLSEAELDLVEALATRIDVHLWLPHPSPALWSALSSGTTIMPRSEDDSASRAEHPLLASLGRDVRELERSLLARHPRDESAPAQEGTGQPTTRLQLLQQDVRENTTPSSSPEIPRSDRSIEVHACHGPARQVEVLREILVGLLDEAGGALQPRDVLVMCPDIETFAPLIHAAFGTVSLEDDDAAEHRHPGQRLRVQLADRALSATNPLVDVAERLLGLVAGRVTAADVLDLLTLPVVQRRFGLDEDDLDLVSRWVAESGIRWGLDGAHRGEYGLGGLEANSWESGLDRIALGVAVSSDATSGAERMLPVDDVGSQAIPTVGSLLEILTCVEGAARQVRAGDGITPGAMTVSAWVEWLRDAVTALTDVPEADRWQVAQFERELALIGESAGDTTRLRLTDVRVMVEQRWAARPTRSNFRTGAVTVCSMVPMRSVPHKVVIALGLDDGVYPRTTVVDGDDVLARRPLTGERDPRAEDGQLLLDALMAAQERFIALYSGFDERSGARRPPAVPLQEVLAAAARTGRGPDRAGNEAAPFLHEHPLQAFDERNFDGTGALGRGSYDRHALDGARALRAARGEPRSEAGLVPDPLPPRPTTAVSVDDLVAFYENPAREFLRRRLEITVPRAQEEPETEIPITVEGLADWKIGDRLLREVRAGIPLPEAVDAERRRGSLPPGHLADPVVERVAGQVQSILAQADTAPHASLDVLVDLPNGIRLRGVVTDVVGDHVETLTYSTVSPKHVVGAWARLLALAASYPDQAWASVLRGKRRTVTLRAPDAHRAVELLTELTDHRQKGMQFPIGIPPKTASIFTTHYERRLSRNPDDRASAVRAGLEAAAREWSGHRFPERGDDPWWARLYGTHSTVEDLDSHHSLTYWAPRVWGPIHAAGGRIA